MAERSKTDLPGLAELERQLRSLEDVATSTKILRGSLSFAAKPMREEAQRLAPVADKTIVRAGTEIAPGTLRDSIRVRTFRGGEGPEDGRHAAASAYLYFTRKGFWGNLLEFGNKHARAAPMLRPAFDQCARGAVDRFGKSLGRRIKRALKRRASQA